MLIPDIKVSIIHFIFWDVWTFSMNYQGKVANNTFCFFLPVYWTESFICNFFCMIFSIFWILKFLLNHYSKQLDSVFAWSFRNNLLAGLCLYQQILADLSECNQPSLILIMNDQNIFVQWRDLNLFLDEKQILMYIKQKNILFCSEERKFSASAVVSKSM